MLLKPNNFYESQRTFDGHNLNKKERDNRGHTFIYDFRIKSIAKNWRF